MSERSELLQALRIERSAPQPATGFPYRLALAIAAAVLLLAAAGWWWLAAPPPQRLATVVARAPDAAAPAAVLQASGYVVARRQATVSAQITGTLVEVLIEEGERVAAGQVLARLEDTAQQAMLAQAEAQLAAVRAQLAESTSQLAQDRRDLARAEELVGRGLVSTQAAELARTGVATQQARVETQRRQVAVAEANLRGAQVQVDYCTVRAPFAGVVIAKAAQVGEIVSPLSAGGGFTRTGIGTIVDMDSLEVEVDVNEAYIQRVEPAQPVEAVLDAYPEWRIPAHVIAIIPTADRSKATVRVRIALEERDARVVPDMGVRVSFLEERPDRAAAAPPAGVLVPASAVVERDGAAWVYVLEAGHARRREVVAGAVQDGQRLVEGIAPGTELLREPPPGLADGARVATGSAGSR